MTPDEKFAQARPEFGHELALPDTPGCSAVAPPVSGPAQAYVPSDPMKFVDVSQRVAPGEGFIAALDQSGERFKAVRPGQLVEARGEVTRGGGKTVFVRGLVTADGTPALSFTGIIRKVNRRG